MTFHFLAHAPRALAPRLVAAAPRPREAAMPFVRPPIHARRGRPRLGLDMHWAVRDGRLEMRWAAAANAPSI